MEKKPLVIIAGPTAVGKTKASIGLAKAVGGEILSADSMQVYRGMDIGSAKIRPDQMEGVPHFLIDCLEPEEEFHVVRFQEMAKAAMEGVYARGHLPILVGGTGFYIQALVRDIDFTAHGGDKALREDLERLARERGADFLHRMLRERDPRAAALIHPNNVKRVIRALEFYEETGRLISDHNEEQRERESPYNFALFVLTDDRQRIYERIDGRVDQMLEDGLVEEVRALHLRGCHRDMVSMQGLGYKEILDYLEGLTTLDEAVRILKRDTRHFAKRQLTWFRRERDAIWIDRRDFGQDEDLILQKMLDVLAGKNIIEPSTDR